MPGNVRLNQVAKLYQVTPATLQAFCLKVQSLVKGKPLPVAAILAYLEERIHGAVTEGERIDAFDVVIHLRPKSFSDEIGRPSKIASQARGAPIGIVDSGQEELTKSESLQHIAGLLRATRVEADRFCQRVRAQAQQRITTQAICIAMEQLDWPFHPVRVAINAESIMRSKAKIAAEKTKPEKRIENIPDWRPHWRGDGVLYTPMGGAGGYKRGGRQRG